MQNVLQKKIVLFGGTFNPPHFSHLLIIYALLQKLEDVMHVEFILSMPWQKKNVLAAAHRQNMLTLALSDWRICNSRIHSNSQEVDNYEKHGTLSYSILTLIERFEYYSKKYSTTNLNVRDAQKNNAAPPFKLIYIIGQDQYQNLHTWHRWQELFDYADIYVISRSGVSNQPNPHIISNTSFTPKIKFLDAHTLYQQLFKKDAFLQILKIWPELNHLKNNQNEWLKGLESISSSIIRESYAQKALDSNAFLYIPQKVDDYIKKHMLYE